MRLPLVNELDLDALRTKVQNAPSFPHFCIDNFLEESFANEVHDSFPSYGEAETLGRLFRTVNEKRKVQITDPEKFPPAIHRLYEILASRDFVGMMSEMIGIKNLVPDPAMIGGGIHETNAGGHLDVHVDFNYHEQLEMHRRVNILVYFNRDWREDYGGYLDLWDRDVKNCVGSYAPIFNRAAGFATSEISWHGVTPMTCPPDRMRKSFAAYYYTKEPPPEWDGTKHSTIFRARPHEYWKGRVAMPAERISLATRELIRSAKRSIKQLGGSEE